MLGRHAGSRLKLNGADFQNHIRVSSRPKTLHKKKETEGILQLTISNAGFSCFLWRLRRMVWTRE